MTLHSPKLSPQSRRRLAIGTLALLAFAAGSLITARLTNVHPVRAAGDRVFELRVYHTVPGKLPALEAQFRDQTSKLLAQHDLNVIGYWVNDNDPNGDNTFIFLLAHPSREEAQKNWAAMMADPAFQQIIHAEQADKKVEKIDRTWMRPTDFSPMK